MLSELHNEVNLANVFKFSSIKDLLNENSVEHSRVQLSFHFKAMILGGVLEKVKVLDQGRDQNQMRRCLAKWRVNSSNKLCKNAIDRLLTSGPIKMPRFFYQLKALTDKGINNRKQGLRHHRNNHQHQEFLPIQSQVKSLSPFISKKSMKSKRSFRRNGRDSLPGGVSLSDIFTPDMNDNQHGNEQLDTYINLFETSLNEQKNKVQLAFNSLIKIFMFKEYQNLGVGFRMILHESFQENFEEQLLKAKRNLQLAQNSLILQNRLQKMDEDHQEQFENLQKISNKLNSLREKFLMSKTKDLIKIMKKLFYPFLKEGYALLKDRSQIMRCEQTNDNTKKYQIQQIFVSETSLSLGPSHHHITSMSMLKTRKNLFASSKCHNFAFQNQFQGGFD